MGRSPREAESEWCSEAERRAWFISPQSKIGATLNPTRIRLLPTPCPISPIRGT